MKCPACGNPEMVTKIQDETLVYGGQSLTLHSMKGDFCPACGEGIWDEESYRRYTEAQTAIVRAVKGDVSADIRRIRKSLKLTQTELSEFGLRQFQALSDTSDIGAHIAFHGTNNGGLRLGVTAITLFVPNPLTARRAEISLHRM